MPAPPDVPILPQPDERTCGPTCLHAIYGLDGLNVDLGALVTEVAQLAEGGTLGVQLANHALGRGYRARIYTYNVQVFDPTWLRGDVDIAHKLEMQARRKPSIKLRRATGLYREFLAAGGELLHSDLTAGFLARLLRYGRPVIAGLSATYLYDCERELDDVEDDVAGYPVGHFVLASHLDTDRHTVRVADPLADNPRYGRPHYDVDIQHLFNSILLGVVTYDANLIELWREPA